MCPRTPSQPVGRSARKQFRGRSSTPRGWGSRRGTWGLPPSASARRTRWRCASDRGDLDHVANARLSCRGGAQGQGQRDGAGTNLHGMLRRTGHASQPLSAARAFSEGPQLFLTADPRSARPDILAIDRTRGGIPRNEEVPPCDRLRIAVPLAAPSSPHRSSPGEPSLRKRRPATCASVCRTRSRCADSSCKRPTARGTGSRASFSKVLRARPGSRWSSSSWRRATSGSRASSRARSTRSVRSPSAPSAWSQSSSPRRS
jgi:hypothetical protein